MVLAFLMLMPAGVCTCGGGARPCPDHPPIGSTHQHDGCSSGCCHKGSSGGTPSAARTDAAAEHHCPAPLPHEPSCPAVTWAAPADTSAAADSVTVLISSSADRAVTWWVPDAPRSTSTLVTTYVPTAPLFLSHCSLLI